jgi:ferrous-iron efflux pump FieF
MSQATAVAERNGRLMRAATYASVGLAATLILAKVAAWLQTDSMSMLSTLVDSLLDLGASLVTFFAVRTALTPPDAEHRFGHGKAEPLAALAQSAFVAGSAALLLFEATWRLFRPKPIEHLELGVGVMVFSVLASGALVLFQRHVAKQTGSLAIAADSVHYRSDLLVNLAVIAALFIASDPEFAIVDPLIGIAIAVFILFSAWTIFRGAFDMLMDREIDDTDRKRIAELVLSHPHVTGYNDLRTRRSGPQLFIQLSIELDGDITLEKAHDIAHEVEARLVARYPEAEIAIHQEVSRMG